jgi:hypothetical protein
MTLRVDLLQGTEVPESTEVFHGTEASCVSELTFGTNVRTRVRERRCAHQTHELASWVPPAHVCAWKTGRDRRSIGRALTHAPARCALTVQHVGHAEAAAHGAPWVLPGVRR